jgi:hypothetical protein
MVVLSLVPMPLGAQSMPWRLTTDEKEQRDKAAPDVPASPDRPPPPTITLLWPDTSRPVRNPVTIEVQFAPGPGGSIDINSFNASYGRLGINITRRLLDHAVVGPSGLSAAEVKLPSGHHRVTLSIADTSGRTASKTIHFSVAGSDGRAAAASRSGLVVCRPGGALCHSRPPVAWL